MFIEFLILFLITFLWIISGREALSKLSRGRIRKIENENRDLGKKVEVWFKNKTSFLTVFKIILFFNISILATLVFSRFLKVFTYPGKTGYIVTLWHITPHVIAAIIITLVLVILAETIAKFLVIRYDIQTLRTIMPFIKFFHYIILYPFIIFINLIKTRIQRYQKSEDEDITTTEDEILSLLESDSESKHKETALEEEERQMIKGIFELNDTDVKEVMTPRVDVVAIPSSAPLEDATKLFIESGHSRIPIYQNTIDEISGIILAKDFLNAENISGKTLTQLSHKPIYIPETKPIGDLLNEFKGTHNHFSVIIDEYGGTAGIVTLEDILEEIVGEIHDEYEPEKEWTYSIADNGSVVMDARTLIDEVNEILKINLPEDDDVDTIGGFLCSKLGKIPEPGEETTIDDILNIKVLEADRRRVMKLQLKVIDNAKTSKKEE